MDTIMRKSLLYKSKVEYSDYTVNHVVGCSHGCKYPCYAMMLAKRFGRVKDYEDWCHPVLVKNALELLDNELPKQKEKIDFVHLCFMTDPFMYKYDAISEMSIKIIEKINSYGIKCKALTKGILPIELASLSKKNEYGITLISLNEEYRRTNEPGSAPYNSRINALKYLSDEGFKTWVSIEPYPTPNIIEQDFMEILESVSFADQIIFGRLNYNKLVSEYAGYRSYYNDLACKVIDFCDARGIAWHIKTGTITENI